MDLSHPTTHHYCSWVVDTYIFCLLRNRLLDTLQNALETIPSKHSFILLHTARCTGDNNFFLRFVYSLRKNCNTITTLSPSSFTHPLCCISLLAVSTTLQYYSHCIPPNHLVSCNTNNKLVPNQFTRNLVHLHVIFHFHI